MQKPETRGVLRMATAYAEAPALPRAPTVIRSSDSGRSLQSSQQEYADYQDTRLVDDAAGSGSARPQPPPPPPPRFPSLKEVRFLLEDDHDTSADDSRNRRQNVHADSSGAHQSIELRQQTQSSALMEPLSGDSPEQAQLDSDDMVQSAFASIRDPVQYVPTSSSRASSIVPSSSVMTRDEALLDDGGQRFGVQTNEDSREKRAVSSVGLSATDIWTSKALPSSSSHSDNTAIKNTEVSRRSSATPVSSIIRSFESGRADSISRESVKEQQHASNEPDSTSVLQKVMALFQPRKKSFTELEAEARAKAETKPALVKAQDAVCKLPDPTLLFLVLLIIILSIHVVRPVLLKTWLARILVPLSIVPTVVASTLWRRTRAISLKPDEKILSAAAPFPNAGLLVIKGEKLRQREAALAKAENELRQGQMTLEVMRKEVESRLPPHVDVNMDADTGEVRRQASYRAEPSQSST